MIESKLQQARSAVSIQSTFARRMRGYVHAAMQASRRKTLTNLTFALATIVPFQSLAATDEVVGKVTEVAVNGGADTVSPGTTCLKLDVPVASACIGGWVAIPNNNSKLVNAASLAKTSATPVALYYVADGASQHCPNRVFTPCAVISIILK